MKLEAQETNRLINGDLTEPDLVWLNADQDPFSLHGVFFDEAAGCYLRMPAETGEKTSPRVNKLNYNTAGGRLRFCTDSPVIAIAAKLHRIPNRPQMTAAGISGWDLYRKESDGEIRFHQALIPPTATCDRYEKMSRTDGTHPNDLGFYSMASAIRPTLKEMLKKNRGKFYEN